MLQKENDFREASESGIEALSLAIVKQAFDDFVSGKITNYEFTNFYMEVGTKRYVKLTLM